MLVCFTFVSSVKSMIYSKQLVLLYFHIWPNFKILVLSSFNSVQVVRTFNWITKYRQSLPCMFVYGASTLDQSQSPHFVWMSLCSSFRDFEPIFKTLILIVTQVWWWCFHNWPSFKTLVLSSCNSVQVAASFNWTSKQWHSSLCKSINGASTLNQNQITHRPK